MSFLSGGFIRDKSDANLRSVDPDELAAPKSEASRRQQQEEFSGSQHLGGSFHVEHGSGLGNVAKNAASAPRTIDTHEIDGIVVLKANPAGLSVFPFHQAVSGIAKAFRSSGEVVAELFVDPKRINRWAVER